MTELKSSKLWQNSVTQDCDKSQKLKIVTKPTKLKTVIKLKKSKLSQTSTNLNCHETQKLKLHQHLKAQIATKLEDSNCDTWTQMIKLKIIMWQNF